MRCHAVVVAAAAVVAACSGAAKSREDFVARASAGERFTRQDHYTIPRPLGDVETSLQAMAQQCYGKTIYKQGAGPAPGSTSTSSATYIAWVRRAADATVQLTLLVLYSPRPVPSPQEGIYYLAADVRDAAPATHVDLYFTFRWKEITESVRSWISGAFPACPELD